MVKSITFSCTLKMWNKITITKTNSNLFRQSQAGAYAHMMHKFQEITFKLVMNHHFHFKMVVMLGQGSWEMVNSNSTQPRVLTAFLRLCFLFL